MIKNKSIFLKEIALLPEMKDNIISLIFANNPDIDIRKRETFYDNVSVFLKKYTEVDRAILQSGVGVSVPDELSLMKDWEGRDFRIKTIRLKSIRGFPDSAIPFGFDLKNKNGDPQCIVILGSNGSGKSSIFNALEYSYCRKIGEAQLRSGLDISDDTSKFETFLEHFENGFNKCSCIIDTVDRPFVLQEENIPKSIRLKINPDTHFISDYDIYSNGQLDYKSGGDFSFHNKIATSLGLSELLAFEKNLKAFTLYSRQAESRQINALEKSIVSQNQIIENANKAISEKKQKLLQLEDTQKSIPQEKNIQDIIILLNRVKDNNFIFTYDYDYLIESITRFKQSFKEFESLKVKTGDIAELQFLNLGLELIKKSDNCPFCESSKKNQSEIMKDVSNRIERIKSLNEALGNLNKEFNNVYDTSNKLFNDVIVFKAKIQNELSLIKETSEFNTLIALLIDVIAKIELNLAEEFFSKGKNLEQNRHFLSNKNEHLSSFLDSHSEYIKTGLKDLIHHVNVFIDDRQKSIHEIDKTFSEKNQGQTIIEQIISLNKEIADLQTQVLSAERTITESKNTISDLREKQQSFDSLKEKTRDYLKVYNNKLSQEVDQAFNPIKSIVEKTLQKYLDIGGRNVSINILKQPDEYDEETGEVLSEIITAQISAPDDNFKPLSVNKYFNTFHYRLFSTMVGISIAMASRIITRINLPLVMDDVFYASDLENRATIENFLKGLFEIFNDKSLDMNFQLILFTHDQQIFESAINASAMNEVENTAFAKLFPFKDADEKDGYKNLIYKIPAYLPSAIMKNLLIEA